MPYRTPRYDIYDMDYVRNEAAEMADDIGTPKPRQDRTCEACGGDGLDKQSDDLRDRLTMACSYCHGTGWAAVMPETRTDAMNDAEVDRIRSIVKPAKGTALLERRQRRASRDASEKAQKALVVKRDGVHYCRLVPGCKEKEKHEVAHVVSKSLMGPSTTRNMLRACVFHHRGSWSLHSGDLRVEFLTDKGADGPICVWSKNLIGEYLVGREVTTGQWERK